MRCTTRSSRHAFTLFELLVTIAIIAVTAVLVAPALRGDEQFRLLAAASILRSDIELAQVMSISAPEDPVVVRFDPANDRYWLALTSAPEVPILRADTEEPYVVTFGIGRAASALGVTYTVVDVTGNVLEFNPQGGLTDFQAEPRVTLNSDDRWIRLDIAPTTGTITETAGSGEDEGGEEELLAP